MTKLLLTIILAVTSVMNGLAVADEATATAYLVLEGQMTGYDIIGLVPEGLRIDSYASYVVTEGIFVGATMSGTDFLLYRHDGVGVVDIRAFAVDPEGVAAAVTMKGFLGEPSPGMIEALLDPEFEMPNVDIPLHGAAWFQTMAPQYAFVNHTVFGCAGAINMLEGVLRITCRSLAE